MQVYSDGKNRVIKGNFPKRFKLFNAGEEVPFIRTGDNSIRLSGVIPVGALDVMEVEKKKASRPVKFNTAEFAVLSKYEIEKIDELNKKVALSQDVLHSHLAELSDHEATLSNLETQNAQEIENTKSSMADMAVAFGKEIQADRENLNKAQKILTSSIKETSLILSEKIEAHENAKNPHKITKATIGLDRVDNTSDEEKPISKATKKALDKKADKTEVDELSKKVEESGKKQDSFIKSFENVNLYGGVGGNVISGGKKGQILTKASNKDGDYIWTDGGSGVEFRRVNSLPQTGEKNVFYLVPSSDPETSNIYDEYIWAVQSGGSYGWEKIGSTEVDLSGYVPTSRTINSKALTTNITLTSDDIEYTTAGTTCTYVFDLFLTAMESLGDSIGGSFDEEGTFSKASYKPSGSSTLNNISDTDEITTAIGWCDRSIGKLTSLTTTVKTDCVSAINEVKGAIPTNNNQLTNGAGYITSSALSGYATENYVDTSISESVTFRDWTV